MRKKLALMLAVGLVAGAFGSVASAQRADSPKVTGGGQIVVDADNPPSGAWDTIAFVGIQEPLSGQVQFVPTSTGGGSSTGHWHGVVDCVRIEENRAVLSGDRFSRGPGGEDRFWIAIQDNAESGDFDTIELDDEPDDEDDCNDEVNGTVYDLGRGNATVHNPSE